MNKVIKWVLIALAAILVFIMIEYIVFNNKMSGTKEIKIQKLD